MTRKRTGGVVDEDQVDMVMKECDEDGDGFIDVIEFVSNSIHRCTAPDCFVQQKITEYSSLEQVNWFKGSEIAHDLKDQARKEKKLQAAYAELGVSITRSAASDKVDGISGHRGTDGESVQRAWAARGNLPGNP